MKKRRISIFTAIILVVLTGYMVWTLAGLYTRINGTRAKNQELSRAVERQSAENDEMRYAVEHSGEDEVISDAARRELGLVYPDETVYNGG